MDEGAAPAAEEAAEAAAEAALLAAEARLEAAELRDEAAEPTADEADSAAELAADEAAELAEAAIPEAWLAALPVSALYRVLKPVVLTAPPLRVARRGRVVTAVLWALWAADASEPVTDAAADAAEPVAVAKADDRMGRAAGMEPETAALLHWAAPYATAAAA